MYSLHDHVPFASKRRNKTNIRLTNRVSDQRGGQHGIYTALQQLSHERRIGEGGEGGWTVVAPDPKYLRCAHFRVFHGKCAKYRKNEYAQSKKGCAHFFFTNRLISADTLLQHVPVPYNTPAPRPGLSKSTLHFALTVWNRVVCENALYSLSSCSPPFSRTK